MLKSKKKDVTVEVDEHPRPQTKIEDLKKLPSIFQKDGLVTAGTASVINLSFHFNLLITIIIS